MQSALPSVMKLSSETKLILEDNTEYEKETLNDKEYLVIEALELQNELSLNEVSRILNQKTIFPTIKSLLSRKVISLLEEISEEFKSKKVRVVRCIDRNVDIASFKNAKKQAQIYQSFLQLEKNNSNEPILVSQLLKTTSSSHQTLNSLVKKNIFSIEEKEISRIESFDNHNLVSFELSEIQQTAFSNIKSSFFKKRRCAITWSNV